MSDDRGLLRRKLERERSARKQAEALIERKSLELWEANQSLARLNEELEGRVAKATADIRSKNDALTRRVRELDALHSVAMALASELRADALLDRILDVSKEVMQAEGAALLLRDRPQGPLHFHVVRGGRGEGVLRGLAVEPGQGVAGTVAETGEPARIRDAYEDPRFDPSFDERTGFRTRALLAAPIRTRDGVIGVLEVLNKSGADAFDAHDEELFGSLASSVSIAVSNSRLFERTSRMTEELREALEKERRLAIEKEKMEAYIPRHVVDEISKSRERKLALGGKTVFATVLFADIQGFTKVSEAMTPERVVGLLNHYMTSMTSIIESEEGTLDKFLGDGIMAIFTPADAGEGMARRAVRAALRMQRALDQLLDAWRAAAPDEATPVRMRVGINTGEMVAGNVGSETRMEFTVIGDNVNVASRIESACKPGEVWVSDTTFSLAAYTAADLESLRVGVEHMAPLHVKNRVKPVRVWALVRKG